jgi:hypothetical protein
MERVGAVRGPFTAAGRGVGGALGDPHTVFRSVDDLIDFSRPIHESLASWSALLTEWQPERHLGEDRRGGQKRDRGWPAVA